MFEHKPNRGSLFKNEKKEKEDDADYNGSLMLEDGEHWLNGYINTSKTSGKKYLGISVGKLKGQQKAAPKPPEKDEEFNDDIPF